MLTIARILVPTQRRGREETSQFSLLLLSRVRVVLPISKSSWKLEDQGPQTEGPENRSHSHRRQVGEGQPTILASCPPGAWSLPKSWGHLTSFAHQSVTDVKRLRTLSRATGPEEKNARLPCALFPLGSSQSDSEEQVAPSIDVTYLIS